MAVHLAQCPLASVLAMSALIAGLDISSKALHAALIPCDPDDGGDAPPVTLRSFDLPVFKPALDDTRVPPSRTLPRHPRRDARTAARRGLQVPLAPPLQPRGIRTCGGITLPTSASKSRSASVSRSTVLWEILGAILACIPPHIERDTIQTHEWRRIVWPVDGR
jgi:hypothetical protein